MEKLGVNIPLHFLGVDSGPVMKDEVFGEHRLIEIVEQNSSLPPFQIQGKIIEAVNHFSGKAPQHDDFTMVIVKIR